MARGKTNKLYRTFVKGLITEAGFLTYPEDSSLDELNTVIKRKGSRSRRFGMEFEPDSVASTIAGTNAAWPISTFVWRSPDNTSTKTFLCVKIGAIVHFYDMNIEPLSSGKKSFTVDLEDHLSPTGTLSDLQNSRCEFASGKGYLFIANSFINPVVVEYDNAGDDVEANTVLVLIRDTIGVDDGLLNDAEPATLSKEHYYNLRNQGWVLPGTDGVFGGGATDPNTPPAPPTNVPPGGYDPWRPWDPNYQEP